MALYTQRVLAESLKKLMNSKSLDTITVKDIVEDCDMNRKTFYYHFHGIYDLIMWMLISEISSVVNKNLTIDTWKFGFEAIMRYVETNKKMMLNICNSRYWPEVRMYLSKKTDKSVETYVESALQWFQTEQNSIIRISDSNMKYVIKYYSLIKFSLIEEWFLGGMKEDINDFLIIFEKLTYGSISNILKMFAE